MRVLFYDTKKVLIGIMFFVCVFMFASCAGQNSHGENNSISILFVGNSHIRTGNMPHQVKELAALHGIDVEYLDVSINGQNLDGRNRNYAIVEMQSRNFDYVVFQPRGRVIAPLPDIEWFVDDVKDFAEHIREHGATPILLSTSWISRNGQPDIELQHLLYMLHKQAADESGIIFINVGGAVQSAYQAINNISLHARDNMHPNNAGAFLTAAMVFDELFEIDGSTLQPARFIDNLPILNIITIVGIAIVIMSLAYKAVKKQPLHIKKSIGAIAAFALLQVMSFFPHVIIFTESGSRLVLLYAIVVVSITFAAHSVFNIIKIRLVKKQPWSMAKQYVITALICIIVCSMTFIPALGLHTFLYRGNDATRLVQVVLDMRK